MIRRFIEARLKRRKEQHRRCPPSHRFYELLHDKSGQFVCQWQGRRHKFVLTLPKIEQKDMLTSPLRILCFDAHSCRPGRLQQSAQRHALKILVPSREMLGQGSDRKECGIVFATQNGRRSIRVGRGASVVVRRSIAQRPTTDAVLCGAVLIH